MSKTHGMSENKAREKISVCDVMKTNTSKVIQKFESQIPAKFQQYSDLYSTYLHTIDDVYGTCYISEKEFFDNLNIDQGVLKSIQEYSEVITGAWLDQIDLYAKYGRESAQMQISYLKFYDNFVHVMMESYAKTLSQYNKVTNHLKNK